MGMIGADGSGMAGFMTAMANGFVSSSKPTEHTTSGEGDTMNKKTFTVTWRGDWPVTAEDIELALKETMEELTEDIKVTEVKSKKKGKETANQGKETANQWQAQIPGQLHTPWDNTTDPVLQWSTATSGTSSYTLGGEVCSPASTSELGTERGIRNLTPGRIMKAAWLVFCVFTALAMGVGLAYGSQITVENSRDTDVTVGLENTDEIACLHLFADPGPDGITVLADGFEVSYNSANQELLLYSYLKENPIPTGDVLTLSYPNVTSNTDISVHSLGASNTTATQFVPVEGGAGSISLTFSREDIDATIQVVIGKLTDGGVDWNEDGAINALDVQGMINELE